MSIDLVPLKQFSERITDGWKMVAGFPLKPGDWCVTMQSPDHVAPANRSKSGGGSRWAKVKAEKLMRTLG